MSAIQEHPDAKRLQLLLRDSPDKPRRIFDLLNIRKTEQQNKKETVILQKMYNPPINAQYKVGRRFLLTQNKQVIEAQRAFKEMYAGFLSKLTRLEQMTMQYYTEGPLSQLKAQIRQYDYIFSTSLGDYPIIADPKQQEKFLSRTSQQIAMVTKLLKKCRFEIKRLTASTDVFKKKVPQLLPVEVPPPPPPPAPAAKPIPKVRSKAKLPELEKPKLITIEDGQTPPPPPPKISTPRGRKAKEEKKKKSSQVHSVISSQESEPSSIQRKEKKKKKQEKVEEKKAAAVAALEAQEQRKQEARESTADGGGSEQQQEEEDRLQFVMKFQEFEGEAFRKFLKVMNLLHHFHEEHESRHILSFTFMPTVSEAQNQDILAFMRNFEIVQAKVAIEPVHFDDLFRDKHLQFLIREASEIASFRFNVDHITVAGYHARKVGAVELRIRHYVHTQKHFSFRHYPPLEQVERLRLFEEEYEIQNVLFPSLKVSSLIFDPVEQRPFFLFPATYSNKDKILSTLQEALQKLAKIQISATEYALQLLCMPDPNFPEMSFIKQLALKSNSVIRYEKDALYQEEQALLLSDLMPRVMAAGRDSVDQEQMKQQAPSTGLPALNPELRLTIDKEQKVSHTMTILSTSKDNCNTILDALRKYLDRMQSTKKVLKLPDGDEEKAHQAKSLLGQRRDKTDFAYDFEQRFSVLLHPVASSSASGVQIYGQAAQQRLAFVELSGQLGMHHLTRKEVEVSGTVGGVLDEVEKKALSAKLKQISAKAQFFVNYNPLANRTFAILFTEKGLADQMKLEMESMLKQYEDMVSSQILGAEYWVLRDQLLKLKLNLKSQVSFFFNTSSIDQTLYLPVYQKKPVWMFSPEGGRNWKKYDHEMAARLQDYYNQGQEFFTAGNSNFSLSAATPNAWMEQTLETRFRVKREMLKVIDRSHKVKYLWRMKELLLRGQSDQVEELIAQLGKRLNRHRAQASQFEIDHPYNPKLAAEVGIKYDVEIEGSLGAKTVKVLGKNQPEALKEYLQKSEQSASEIKYPTYWTEVEKIGTSDYNERQLLDPRSQEYVREATRFLDTIGNASARVVKIERLQNMEQWHRYSKEKSILEEIVGDQEDQLEKILFNPWRGASGEFRMQDFLEERKQNLSKFHQARPLSNTFAEEARFFAKFVRKNADGIKEMVVSRVLLGAKYDADRKQGVEWIVPPQKRHGKTPLPILSENKEILIANELDEEETMRRLIQTPVEAVSDLSKAEYYDSVEVQTLQGQVFAVFHCHHSFPCYLVSYTDAKN